MSTVSDLKAKTDPNYTGAGKSGNEGRLHPGLRHPGSYGRPPALTSWDPDPKVRAAENDEYRRRQVAYENRR